MAFKFTITSDALTNYGKVLDSAKLNPYFDSSYLAQTTSAQSKMNYVYGLSALNSLSSFKQDDFSIDAYNAMASGSKEAAFAYLMYKGFDQKDSNVDSEYAQTAEYYQKMLDKSKLSGIEKVGGVLSGIARDFGLFTLDVLDTVVDFPFVAWTLVVDPLDTDKNYLTSWTREAVKSDWIESWASGGKTISELRYQSQLEKFYTTDEYATVDDAISGASLTKTPSLGNALDITGSALGSMAKMCLNFIPGVGSAVYWSFTAAEMAKEEVVTVDDPWLRLVRFGGQFAVEYVTEMMFSDSFIEAGWIHTEGWISPAIQGTKRLLAKMGNDMWTNAIEEMASEILDTMLDQGLYSAYDVMGGLGAEDVKAITPDWSTLAERTALSGFEGALTAMGGAPMSRMMTQRSVSVDEEGNQISLNKIQSWSQQNTMEAVASFADPMFEENKAADAMNAERIMAGKPALSDEEIASSDRYKAAAAEDAEHQKSFSVAVQGVRQSLSEKGYKSADAIAKSVSENFSNAVKWYRNYQLNSMPYSRMSAEERKTVSHKGVFVSIDSFYSEKAKEFFQHYNGNFNISITNSSYVDPTLETLSDRAGLSAILIGTIGSKLGKTTPSPFTIITEQTRDSNGSIVDSKNVLFIEAGYYAKTAGTRGISLSKIIVAQFTNKLVLEPFFAGSDNKFYKKIISLLKGDNIHGSLPFTGMIEKYGLAAAKQAVMQKFLSSPAAMRSIFMDYPEFQDGFNRIINKKSAELIKQYGDDAEGRMFSNHLIAVVTNAEIEASTSDIATFNKALAIRLRSMALDMPLADRLDFISKAMRSRMDQIKDQSTTPDISLLRDLGWTQRINKSDVIKSEVRDYLDSSGIIAMAYRERSSLQTSFASDLRHGELAAILLQSEDVQRYLGISNPEFRNLFIAHLANEIANPKTAADLRASYLTVLDRFVKVSFAMAPTDIKTQIGDYLAKIHSAASNILNGSPISASISEADGQSNRQNGERERLKEQEGAWKQWSVALPISSDIMAKNIRNAFPTLSTRYHLETLGDVMGFFVGNESAKASESSILDSRGAKISQEQAAFFKDSVIRAADGGLLAVYHGTPSASFDSFDASKGEGSHFGKNVAFFTDRESVAAGYTEDYSKGNIYSAYLNIRHPYVFDAKGAEWDELEIGDSTRPVYFAKWGNVKGSLSLLDVDDLRDFYRFLDMDPDIKEDFESALSESESEGKTLDQAVAQARKDTLSYAESEFGLTDDTDVAIGKASSIPGAVKGRDLQIRHTTRDLVESVLKRNEDLRSSGHASDAYDGLVIRNVIDEGKNSISIGKTSVANDYITFSADSIKSISNETPAEGPGINAGSQTSPFLSFMNGKADSNGIINVDIHDIMKYLGIEEDRAGGYANDGAMSFVSHLFYGGDKISSDYFLSGSKISVHAISQSKVLESLSLATDLIIDSTPSGLPRIYKAADIRSFIRTGINGEDSDAGSYIRNLFDSGEPVANAPLDYSLFGSAEGYDIRKVGIEKVLDVLGFVKYLYSEGVIKKEDINSKVGELTSGFSVYLLRPKYDHGTDYTGTIDRNGIMTSIDNGYEAFDTLLHELTHFVTKHFGDAVTGRMVLANACRTPGVSTMLSLMFSLSNEFLESGKKLSMNTILAPEDTSSPRRFAGRTISDAMADSEYSEVGTAKEGAGSLTDKTISDMLSMVRALRRHGIFGRQIDSISEIDNQLYWVSTIENVARHGSEDSLFGILGDASGYAHAVRAVEEDLSSNEYVLKRMKMNENVTWGQSIKTQKAGVAAESIPDIKIADAPWLTDDQKAILKDVGSIRESLIEKGLEGSERGIFISTVINSINSAKTVEELSRNAIRQIAGLSGVYGSLAKFVASLSAKKAKVTVEQAEKALAAPKAAPSADKTASPANAAETAAAGPGSGRQWVSRTSFGGAETIPDSDEEKGKYRIDPVKTSDPRLQNKVISVREGGVASDGRFIPAIIKAYVYFGKPSELNITRIGSLFTVKGANADISDETSVDASALSSRIRDLGYNIGKLNLDNLIRSPLLADMDSDDKKEYKDRVKDIKRQYRALKLDALKARTEEDLDSYLSGDGSKAVGKLESLTNRLGADIRKEIGRLRQTAIDQKKYEMESDRSEWMAKKQAFEEEMTANRKQALKTREQNISRKLALIDKRIKADKKSDERNLSDTIKESSLNESIPEWGLLHSILTKDIKTTDQLKSYLEQDPDAALAFHKFLSPSRPYAYIRAALETALGKNLMAFRSALDVAYDSRTSEQEKARVYDRADSAISRLLRTDISKIDPDAFNERLNSEDDGLASVFDGFDTSDQKDIDILCQKLSEHPGIYDKTGVMTANGQAIRDFVESYSSDITLPESIKVEDIKKTSSISAGVVGSDSNAFLLSAAQQQTYDSFIKRVEGAGAAKLTPRLKDLLKVVFGYSTTISQSQTLEPSADGITANMFSERTTGAKFVEEYGSTLRTLSSEDWAMLSSFLYNQTLRRALPSEVKANIMNVSNFYLQLWGENAVSHSGDAVKALDDFNLIATVMLHDSAVVLAKGKKRRSLLLGGSSQANLPEMMKVGMVNYYMDNESLTADAAIEKAEKKLKFMISLQFFAKGAGLGAKLRATIAGTEESIKRDSPDAFSKRISLLLKDSHLYDQDEINAILSGKEELDSSAMAAIWRLADNIGDYLTKLYIMSLYEDKAKEMLKGIRIRDIFDKNLTEDQRDTAKLALMRKISGYRYLSMLSNISVPVKNFTQNVVNTWADRYIIAPATGKLFGLLNDRLGSKVVYGGGKQALSINGLYANFSLTAGKWQLTGTESHRAMALTYTQGQVESIQKAYPDAKAVAGVQQYNLSSGVKVTDKATSLVNSLFVDSGLLDYLQSRNKMSNINEDTLDRYISKTNPFVSKPFMHAYNLMYTLLEGNDYSMVRKQMIYYLGQIVESEKLYELQPAAGETNIAKAEVFKQELDKAAMMAFTSSLEVVYKSDNKLMKAIQELYKNLPGAALVGQVLVPFPRVSSNILIQIGKYSPFGLGAFIAKAFRINHYGMTLESQGDNDGALIYSLAKDGIKGAVGTALYTIGAILAGLGLIRIDENKDYHGFVLYVGSVKVDISNISVLAQPILLGASLNTIFSDPSGTANQFLAELNNLTFLGNVLDMFQTYDLKSIPEELVDSYVLSYIPSLLKSIYKWYDPYDKNTSSSNPFYKLFLRAMPMFAPNKVDPYTGEDQRRYATPFWNDFFNSLSPMPIYDYASNDAQKTAGELGVSVSDRTLTSVSFDGVLVGLSKDEMTEYNKTKGASFSWLVSSAVKSAAWKSATAEERVKMLKAFKSYATEFAKVKAWLAANPANTYEYTSDSAMNSLLAKYLKNSRIRKVSKAGVNYYGSWGS